MKNSEDNFQIVTYQSATKKNVPYKKKKIQSFSSLKDQEKELDKKIKLGINTIEVIDTIKQTKTLYHKSLRAKNYTKKMVSM